tara:strand:+ start:391 stop:651 length:261 start_codon:yes stop_codon:yes gene_type:complete
MDINQLKQIVKKKILKNIETEEIKIEDKTFLHKNHVSHDKNKFHLKLSILSKELKSESRVIATKKIYKILDDELKHYIHSLQINLL